MAILYLSLNQNWNASKVRGILKIMNEITEDFQNFENCSSESSVRWSEFN